LFYLMFCIDFTLTIVLFQVLPFAEIMISTAGREHFELYLERDGNESLLGYNLFVCLFCILFSLIDILIRVHLESYSSLKFKVYLFYNQKIIDPCGTYIQSQVNTGINIFINIKQSKLQNM